MLIMTTIYYKWVLLVIQTDYWYYSVTVLLSCLNSRRFQAVITDLLKKNQAAICGSKAHYCYRIINEQGIRRQRREDYENDLSLVRQRD